MRVSHFRRVREKNRGGENSVKNVLIGGIGNVLLGDDAIGPYVIQLLESRYTFADNVEIADLGTPALDLTQRIMGMHAVILVDSIAADDQPSGTVLMFRHEDIRSESPSQRLDPHSPALSECLMAAEMLGSAPTHLLLVGIVGSNYEPGCPLSKEVNAALEKALDAVVAEITALGISYEKRPNVHSPAMWWCAREFSAPHLPIP